MSRQMLRQLQILYTRRAKIFDKIGFYLDREKNSPSPIYLLIRNWYQLTQEIFGLRRRIRAEEESKKSNSAQ